jgi:hypothetical protein
VTVRRDTRGPSIAFGAAQPPANSAGWNNTAVLLPVTVDDGGGSGVDPASLPGPLSFTAETAGETRSVSARDLAGNRATAVSPSVKIDRTAPTTTATLDHPLNAQGWSNVPVTLTLLCADALAGCAATTSRLDGGPWITYAGPVRLATEGSHTLEYRSTDRAENTEAIRSLTVRLDFTPPGASIRFDPATLDLAVAPRDPGDTVTLLSSIVVPKGRPRLGDDDELQGAELRSYRLRDQADNTQVVVVAVRREGHHLTATVISQQVNGGPIQLVAPDRIDVEWSLAADGSLRTLEQQVRTGRGRDQRQVDATYNAARGRTEIRDRREGPDGRPFTRPGLVLVRLETSAGGVTIAYD